MDGKKNVLRMLVITFIILISYIRGIDALSEGSSTLPFLLLDKEVYPSGRNFRIVQRIIINLDTIPSEKALRAATDNIWKNGNSIWPAFTVVAYLKNSGTENAAYCIAEYDNKGLKKIDINKFVLDGLQNNKHNEDIGILSACKNTTKKSMRLKVEKIGLRAIRVIVESNFSDGTIIQLIGRRQYFQWGKDLPDMDTIFTHAVVVKNGSVDTIIEVEESKWYQQRISDIKNNSFKGFRSITPMFRVSAFYSPVLQNFDSTACFSIPENKNLFPDTSLSDIGMEPYLVEKDIEIPFER